jgi:hypothetical protein
VKNDVTTPSEPVTVLPRVKPSLFFMIAWVAEPMPVTVFPLAMILIIDMSDLTCQKLGTGQQVTSTVTGVAAPGGALCGYRIAIFTQLWPESADLKV